MDEDIGGECESADRAVPQRNHLWWIDDQYLVDGIVACSRGGVDV